MTDDLPLLVRQGQTWVSKSFDAAPPAPPTSLASAPTPSPEGELIKRCVPTPEAEQRFLNTHSRGVLTRHGRETRWNQQIPYRHFEPGCGMWLFYYAGEGKKAKLWDVYFKRQHPMDSAA